MTRALLLFLAILALPARQAHALPVNLAFTGSFTADTDTAWLSFTIFDPGPVTLRTTSYAGGTNAAGLPIPRGGFDPVVAVFTQAGLLVAQNDDGDADVPADTLTNATFDSFQVLDLAPGSYNAVLLVFDNEAIGPGTADGFLRGGTPNFTTSFNCPDAQANFNDVSGLPGCGRTGNWALDIYQAAVPEPTSLALLAIPLAALATRRRRHHP